MSYPNEDIEYCPTRANIDWSNIQFTDYSKGVAVADFSNVKYFEPSDSEAEAEEEDQGEEGNGQPRAEASGGKDRDEEGRPQFQQSPLSKKAKQKAKKKARAAAKVAKLDDDDGEEPKDVETPASPPVEEEEDDKPSGKKGKGKSKKGKKNAKKNAKTPSTSKSVPQDEASSSSKPPTLEPKGEESTAEKPVEASATEDSKPEPAEEPKPEPAEEPKPEPADSEPKPSEEPKSEPVEEAKSEPAAEPDHEPAKEAEPEAVAEADPEPAKEAEPEAVAEPEPEPEAKGDSPPDPIDEIAKEDDIPQEPQVEESPKAEEPEPEKDEEVEPEKTEEPEPEKAEVSAPAFTDAPTASEPQDESSVPELEDEPSPLADQPEVPSAEPESETKPAEPEGSDDKEVTESVAPPAEAAAEDTKDESTPPVSDADPVLPQDEEPSAHETVEEIKDEPQTAADEDGLKEPEKVESETPISDDKVSENVTNDEDPPAPTPPAPEEAQAVQEDSKPPEEEGSGAPEAAVEQLAESRESSQEEESTEPSDQEPKPEDNPKDDSLSTGQEDYPETVDSEAVVDEEAPAEAQAPAESEAPAPDSDTKDSGNDLAPSADEPAVEKPSEDNASNPEPSSSEDGNTSPAEPKVSEVKDESAPEPTATEANEPEKSPESVAEEDDTAPESQKDEAPPAMAVAPESEDAPAEEPEVEKPSDNNDPQEPNESENPAEQASSAPVEVTEQAVDDPAEASDEPEKVEESPPKDDDPSESETKAHQEVAESAEAATKLDEKSEEKQDDPSPAESEATTTESPETDPPSVTEKDGETSQEDSPSDPVESDEAAASKEPVVKLDDEPQPEDTTSAGEVDGTGKDGDSEAKPAEEPTSDAEPQVDSSQVAETSQDSTTNAEASTAAEGDDGDGNDIAEPESPSAKQVRFADNPEVITAPLSRDGGILPAEEQPESAPNSEEAPEVSNAEAVSEPEDAKVSASESNDDKPSDEPSQEPSGTEAEPPAEVTVDEPQKEDITSNDDTEKSKDTAEDLNEKEEPGDSSTEAAVESPSESKTDEPVDTPATSDDPSDAEPLVTNTPEAEVDLHEEEAPQTKAEADDEAKEITDVNVESDVTEPPEPAAGQETSENDAASSSNVEEPSKPSDESPESNAATEAPASQEVETKDDTVREPDNEPADSKLDSEEVPGDSAAVEEKSKAEDEQTVPAAQSDEADSPAEAAVSEAPKEADPDSDDFKEDEPKENEPKKDEPKEDEPKEDEPKEDEPKEDESKEVEQQEQAVETSAENEQSNTVEGPEAPQDLVKPEDDPKGSEEAEEDEPQAAAAEENDKGGPEPESELVEQDKPAPDNDQTDEPTEKLEDSVRKEQPAPSSEAAAIEEAKVEEKSDESEPQADPVDDLKDDEPKASEEPTSQEAEELASVPVDDGAAKESENVDASEPKTELKEAQDEAEPVTVEEEPAKVDDTPPAPPESDKDPKPEDDESKDTLGPIPSTEKAEKTDKGEDHSAFYSHDTPGVGGNFVSNPIEESLLAEDMDDGGAKMNIVEDSRQVSEGPNTSGQTQSPSDEDEGGVQYTPEIGATAEDATLLDDAHSTGPKNVVQDDEPLPQELENIEVEKAPIQDPDPSINSLPTEEQEFQRLDDGAEAVAIVQNDDMSQVGGSTPLGTEGSGGVPLENLPVEEDSSDHGVNLEETNSTSNTLNNDLLESSAHQGLEEHSPDETAERDESGNTQNIEGSEAVPSDKDSDVSLHETDAIEQAHSVVSTHDMAHDKDEALMTLPTPVADELQQQRHEKNEFDDPDPNEGTPTDIAQENVTEDASGPIQASGSPADENSEGPALVAIDQLETAGVAEDDLVQSEAVHQTQEHPSDEPETIVLTTNESQESGNSPDQEQDLPPIISPESHDDTVIKDDVEQDTDDRIAGQASEEIHVEDAIPDLAVGPPPETNKTEEEPSDPMDTSTRDVTSNNLSGEPASTETTQLPVDLSEAEPVQDLSPQQESTDIDAPSSDHDQEATGSLDDQEHSTSLLTETILPHENIGDPRDSELAFTEDVGSVGDSKESLDLEDGVPPLELAQNQAEDDLPLPPSVIESEKTQGDDDQVHPVEPIDDHQASIDPQSAEDVRTSPKQELQDEDGIEAVQPRHVVIPELEDSGELPSETLSDDFVLVHKDDVVSPESSINIEEAHVDQEIGQLKAPLDNAPQSELGPLEETASNEAAIAVTSIETDGSTLESVLPADDLAHPTADPDTVMAAESTDDKPPDEKQDHTQTEVLGDKNIIDVADQEVSRQSEGSPGTIHSLLQDGSVKVELADPPGHVPDSGLEKTSDVQTHVPVPEEFSLNTTSNEPVSESLEPTTVEEPVILEDSEPSHEPLKDTTEKPEHVLEPEDTANVAFTEADSAGDISHVVSKQAASGEIEAEASDSVASNVAVEASEDVAPSKPDARLNEMIEDIQVPSVEEDSSRDDQNMQSGTSPEESQPVPSEEIAGDTVSEKTIAEENVIESTADIQLDDKSQENAEDNHTLDAVVSLEQSPINESIVSDHMETPSIPQELGDTEDAPMSKPLSDVSAEETSSIYPMISATTNTEEVPAPVVTSAESNVPISEPLEAEEPIVIEKPRVDEELPSLEAPTPSSPRIDFSAMEDIAGLSSIPEAHSIPQVDGTSDEVDKEPHDGSELIEHDKATEPDPLPEQDSPVENLELISEEDDQSIPAVSTVSGLGDEDRQHEVPDAQVSHVPTKDTSKDSEGQPHFVTENPSVKSAQKESETITEPSADDHIGDAMDYNEPMPPSPQPSLDDKAATPALESQVPEEVNESLDLASEETHGKSAEPERSVEPVILAASVEPQTRDISESKLDSASEIVAKESPIELPHIANIESSVNSPDEPPSEGDQSADVITSETLQPETILGSDAQDKMKAIDGDDSLRDPLVAAVDPSPLSFGQVLEDSTKAVEPPAGLETETHTHESPGDRLAEDIVCEESIAPDSIPDDIPSNSSEDMRGEDAGGLTEASAIAVDQNQIAESMSDQPHTQDDLETVPIQQSSEAPLTSAPALEDGPAQSQIDPKAPQLDNLEQSSTPKESPSANAVIDPQMSVLDGLEALDDVPPLDPVEEKAIPEDSSDNPPPEPTEVPDKSEIIPQEAPGQESDSGITEPIDTLEPTPATAVGIQESVLEQAALPKADLVHEDLPAHEGLHSIDTSVKEDLTLPSQLQSFENQVIPDTETHDTIVESITVPQQLDLTEESPRALPVTVPSVSEDDDLLVSNQSTSVAEPPAQDDELLVSNQSTSMAEPPAHDEELVLETPEQVITEQKGEQSPRVLAAEVDTKAVDLLEPDEADQVEAPATESPLDSDVLTMPTEEPSEGFSKKITPVDEVLLSEQQEASSSEGMPSTEESPKSHFDVPVEQSPDSSQSHEQEPEAKTSTVPLFSDYTLEDLQAEPEVTPPPVETVRELISTVLDSYREGDLSQTVGEKEPVLPLPVDTGESAETHLHNERPGSPVQLEAAQIVPEVHDEKQIVPESPIIPPMDDYEDDHKSHLEEPESDATPVAALINTQVVTSVAAPEDSGAVLSDDEVKLRVLDEATKASPRVSEADDLAEDVMVPSPLQVETKDIEQVPESAATESHSRELPPLAPTVGIKSTPSADLDSPHVVEENVPLSESFTIVDEPPTANRESLAHQLQSHPETVRTAPDTPTEDLFRPKTPLQNLMRAAMSQEFRAPTPAIEIPDPEDPRAKQLSRARSVRRKRRQTIRDAEELIAATVVIYAAAEALSPPGSPPLASNLDKDLAKEEEPVVLSLSDSTAQGAVEGNSTGEEDALRKSVADLLAEDKSRELKSDDKSHKSSRSSHRSSHHSSRSTRSRDGNKDNTAKVPHHHHHKRRSDSEPSARSGSEQGSPRTPKRQDSGFSSSHSARSKKERTPEEQAAHDRRKERHLAREKERLNDSSPSKSPSKSSKGKEPETEKSSSHRSSRRHSHASATVTKENSPVPPPKKFFDMKNGQSVLQSNFTPREGSVDKEIARSEIPQRSNTTRSAKGRVRKSVDASRAKLQKARDESSEGAKETTAAESDGGPEDAPAAGNEHRKTRQERRQKEGGKDHGKPGFRAAIKRFFTS